MQPKYATKCFLYSSERVIGVLFIFWEMNSNSDTGFAEPDLVLSPLVAGFYTVEPEEGADAD